jgi:hypothetical protein
MAASERRWWLVQGVLALPWLLGSCSIFGVAGRSYESNREAIEACAAACGLALEGGDFELEGIDLREDSMTFLCRGKRFPGDHGWIVRFSEKSTEQDPVALADVYSFLPVLAEGRRGFQEVDRGERESAGERLRYVRYRFTSPITDEAGRPLAAHGIVVSLRRESSRGPVVFQIKLDNHGDREDVGLEDVAPLVEAARAVGE